MSFKGKCIIISAPSGAGKTSIVRYLLKHIPELSFSVSATNRKPRVNETNGVDYHFLSTVDFEARIKNKEFVEWEEVYEGQYYGTLQAEVERLWKTDHHVIFDVDVVGGLNLKEYFGENALSIFVQAPDVKALETRLRSRQTESEEQLAIRLAKAAKEMEFAKDFDEIVINDVFEIACEQAMNLVKKFLSA
jgi:guanylate kinase